MKKIVIALVLFVSSIASARTCIPVSRISGFTGLSDTQVEIHTSRQDYLVKVAPCFGLKYAWSIAFQTYPSGSSQVCKQDFILIIDEFSGQPERRCMILDISEKN